MSLVSIVSKFTNMSCLLQAIMRRFLPASSSIYIYMLKPTIEMKSQN